MSRFKEFVNHPLSPAPLVVVCVGYWMPLQWMISGQSILGNATWIGALHAMATSTWIEFFPAALWGAACAYALAGPIFLLFDISFKRAAGKSLDFLTFFVFLAITSRILKLLTIGLLSAQGWPKAVSPFILILGSLWLTRRNFTLMRWILIPKYLTLAVMPLALVSIFLEIEHEGKSAHNIHTMGSLHNESPSNAENHPDVILITVDTLTAAHLHTYGYSIPTSPRLDDFSMGAILFENFYANANWTRPGIASILNGARPWTHRGDLGKPLPIVTDAQNLIGRLADGGYDIRTVSSNEFADLEWQGVKTVPARRAMLYPYPYIFRILGGLLPSVFPASLLGPHEILDNYFPKEKTREYVPQSVILLNSAPSDRPLFFWLHIMSPHSPYATQAPYLGTFEPSPMARTPSTSEPPTNFHTALDSKRARVLEGRYDEAVLMGDDVIGEFLDALKTQGLFDRSLVVLTADHGESFNPRYGGHGGPLLTEELIRVPCLIKPPFQRGGKRESLLFEQVDLAPTILSFANLPIPAGMEGKAYPSKPKNVPIFSMNRDLQLGQHTLSVALRDGDWKYVIHFGRWKFPWPQKELYNIAEDPNENTNLVERQPQRTESMHQRILRELALHGVDAREYQQ